MPDSQKTSSRSAAKQSKLPTLRSRAQLAEQTRKEHPEFYCEVCGERLFFTSPEKTHTYCPNTDCIMFRRWLSQQEAP